MAHNDDCPDDPTGFHNHSSDGYTVGLYRGFASRAIVVPGGAPAPITLYQQEKPYHCKSADKRPAKHFNITLDDPAGRDVRLKVSNTPQWETEVGWEGPIASITVVLGAYPGPPSNNRPDLVELKKGEGQVASIWVDTYDPPASSGIVVKEKDKKGKERGGVVAMQSSGDTWVIYNNAQTCPKQCGDATSP